MPKVRYESVIDANGDGELSAEEKNNARTKLRAKIQGKMGKSTPFRGKSKRFSTLSFAPIKEVLTNNRVYFKTNYFWSDS